MLDCGCLDRFITEQKTGSAAGEGAVGGVKRLTVNTASPVKGEGAVWEEGKKKRKTPAPSTATPKTAKKAKADKPTKSSPSPSAAKKRKAGAGAGSPVPSDSPSTPFAATSGLSSVPALVRSNTMPAEAASIMNSPTAYDGLMAPAAVAAVAAVSSKASPSPRKAPAKTATPKRTPAVKAEKGAGGAAAAKRAVKVGLPLAAASASAPNTPMSSRVLDVAAQRRVGGAGRTGGREGKGGRAGSPTVREPHSPAHSSASVLSSVSGSSSSSYSVGVESALSPSLHYSAHHSDPLLPALSLPSSYPEVSLPGVMLDLMAPTPDDDALYRSPHFSTRYTAKMKAELVDDLPPHTSSYRYRPRTLSESHPSHPLHALQDPSPAFPHDFLVHEPSSSMPGEAAQPLSPQSYHSGDSMDTEHSSPMPDLEGGGGAVVDVAHKQVLGVEGGVAVSDSSWALNLDHMDGIALTEMSVS